MEKFQGEAYRLSNNWFSFIDLQAYKNREIKYLEIGTFYGANLFSVEQTYAAHQNSQLHCIDPWVDYDAFYSEHRGQQENIYNTFLKNIENLNCKEKVVVHRGYSRDEIPKLEDDFFDIIYIDGNHEAQYVLEDAVLAFRKLKIGGILIFDDYGWQGPDMTKRGIDAFLLAYFKSIEILGEKETQVFVKKVKDFS